MGDPVTISFFINLAITAVSVYYQREQQRKMKEAMKDRAATRQVRLSGSNHPIPLMYGYAAAVNPIDVYTNVASNFATVTNYPSQSQTNVFGGLNSFSGNKNELLILQKVLCAAPIQDVIWVDVEEVDYTKNEYNAYTRVYADKEGGINFTGADTGRLSTVTFNNLAYSTEFFRMNRDDPQFSNKPQTLYYIKGRKVVSVENSSTITQNKIFSNNTVDVLFDYLTDNEFGANLSIDMLDLDSFYAARAIAERPIPGATRPVFGKIYSKQSVTSRTIKTHEFNGTVLPDKDHITNIGIILNSIPGSMIVRSANGKLKISIPENEGLVQDISVGTITDSLLSDDITFSQADSNSKLNRVRVSFPNSAKDFADDSYEYKNETYFSLDNNVLLSTEITAEGISNIYHAEGFAKAMMNESRLSTFKFTTTHECLVYEPGDVIRLVSERNDLDRYVRITKVDMNSELLIDFEAIEYDPSIYSYASTEIETEFQRRIFDFTLEAPTNLVANVINSSDALSQSAILTWTAPDNNSVNEYVLQTTLPDLLSNGETVYIDLAVIPASNSTSYSYIHIPAVPGGYIYRVRAKTSLGRVSEWSNTATASMTAGSVSPTILPELVIDKIVVKRDSNGVFNTTGSSGIDAEGFLNYHLPINMIGPNGPVPYITANIPNWTFYLYSNSGTAEEAGWVLPPGRWAAAYYSRPRSGDLDHIIIGADNSYGVTGSLSSTSTSITNGPPYSYLENTLLIKVDTNSTTLGPAAFTVRFYYNKGNQDIDLNTDVWYRDPVTNIFTYNPNLIISERDIEIKIVSDGLQGADGADGDSGERGATWFRYDQTLKLNGTQQEQYQHANDLDFTAADYVPQPNGTPTVNQSLVSFAWNTYTGFFPTQYDKFILKVFTDATFSEEVALAFVYDEPTINSGTLEWLIQTEFIDGNLLVNGTVTAEKVAVTSLDAISAVIGTLRTRTEGQRLEINSESIKVFDEFDRVRVKIGYLG